MRASWKHVTLAASVFIVLVGVVALVSAGSEDGDKGPDPGQGNVPPHSEHSEPQSFVPSASSNIYVVDVATRRVEQLTKNNRDQLAAEPAWSPTGDIVFSQAPSSHEPPRLFLIKADASNRRRVPTGQTALFQPSWAPDGRRIAAVRLGSGIYVVDLANRSVRRLEGSTDADEAPAWSPDGRTIVFQRQVTATNWELYQLDSTGGGLRRLTRDPLQQINPAWSPDGSRLAFAEQRRSGKWAVYSMRLDGSDRKLLSDPSLSSQDPAWSSDGRKIAFVLQAASRESIAVVDADGGSPRRLTPNSLVQAGYPFWSPDSKKVVFSARRAARPPPAPAPGA